MVEIFLIPGFGFAGIAGILLIAGSLIFSCQDFVIPYFTWQWDILNRNILVVFGQRLWASSVRVRRFPVPPVGHCSTPSFSRGLGDDAMGRIAGAVSG